MLKILKGDDTDFLGRVMRVTFDVDGVDLTGCVAELSFCGFVKKLPCDGGCDFVFALSAEETESLPLGTHFATFRLFDPAGRVFTLSKSLQVTVTDDVSVAYGSEVSVNGISVSLTSVLGGKTFDIGGTNGDMRRILATLAESLGATVINSEEAP